MFRTSTSTQMTAAAAVLLSALLSGCAPEPADTTAAPSEPAAQTVVASAASADPVARGRYLVTVAGCNDCHTPFKMGPKGPEPDMTRMLSGHPETLVMPEPPQLGGGPWVWLGAGTNTAFAGPWGVSYGTNLTPDQNTGIGIWTEEQFIQTMRTGRHWGQARPILPPMPWPNYARMTDDDLKAMYAYLRTIPPIANRVPEAVVAPPPTAAPAS